MNSNNYSNLYKIQLAEQLANLSKTAVPQIDYSLLLEPVQESLEALNKITTSYIKSSCEDLTSMNQQLIKSINLSLSHSIYKSLNKFSLNTAEYLASINKDLMINSLNLISASIDKLNLPTDNNVANILESHSEISEVISDLSTNPNKDIDIHTWVCTIGTIITVLISLYNLISSSNSCKSKSNIPTEYEINQQETLEEISSYLEALLNSSNLNVE